MASKLNLEDDNVFCRELTVAEARDVDDLVEEKITEWLDEAQAKVFTAERPDSYLVIRIVPSATPR